MAAVYKEDATRSLFHSEVPGLLPAMRKPEDREFQVPDAPDLAMLKRGMKMSREFVGAAEIM